VSIPEYFGDTSICIRSKFIYWWCHLQIQDGCQFKSTGISSILFNLGGKYEKV